MNIFIMRHGEAEVMANSDKARRLTVYGIKQAFTQGQWLRKQLELATPDRIIISPYVRAQETFEQVNQAFNGELSSKIEIWDGVTPYGHAEMVTDYFSVLRNEGIKSIFIVSHLPLVGEIVAELYGKRNPISFYPATIAYLNWSGQYAKILMYKNADALI